MSSDNKYDAIIHMMLTRAVTPTRLEKLIYNYLNKLSSSLLQHFVLMSKKEKKY